ncbi:MAG TPA: hypothetical protein VKM94_14015 [Blastocatellia bacterium]|nr:hypothetical protein [Blastocatellia bacterium]
MATRVAKQASEHVEPEEVQLALEAILTSKHFVNARRRKKFLLLVCDFYLQGRAAELNEYVIAYDVFGRGNDYHPSSDPIVRVVAHEIRKKLEAYYQAEGAADSIRIDIPAGSYQPAFYRQPVKPDESQPPQNVSIISPPKGKRVSIAKLAPWGVVVALSVAIAGLVYVNQRLRAEAAAARAPKETGIYGELWQPFFADSAAPLVVLSNPPVLRLSNPSDPEASERQSITLTPEAVEALRGKAVMNPEIVISNAKGSLADAGSGDEKVVVRQNKTPRLILSTDVYTGMGEAIGLFRLTDLFRSTDKTFVLKQSRTVRADDLKSRNVILLGGVWVNEWSGKLPKTEDFVFTGSATVENRNVQQGEQSEYIPQFDGRTGALMVDYALVTVRPNISEQNRVMLLAGVYSQGTEAAVEYVTNHWHLSQLNQKLRQLEHTASSLPCFQALLRVEVEDGIPTTITLVALHELKRPAF